MSCRQADKAAVQLAANAQDPAIRALIVDLLNELQPEVDEYHRSEAGQKLREEVEEKSRLIEASIAIRRQDMLARKTSKDDATETANKASDPSTNNGRKREGQRPNRFSPSAYEEDEEYVLRRFRSHLGRIECIDERSLERITDLISSSL